MLLGNTVTLTAAVSGTTNLGISWAVAGIPGGNSTVGTISANGIFTAPQGLPMPSSVIVQAASVADPTKSASATITIASDISVAIAPVGAPVELGAQQIFQAVVTSAGKPTAAMNWTLLGAGCSRNGCGTVTSGGVYTAPQILPVPPTVLLTATSLADPSKSVSVPITITSHFTLSVNGPSPVAAGGSGNFCGYADASAEFKSKRDHCMDRVWSGLRGRGVRHDFEYRWGRDGDIHRAAECAIAESSHHHRDAGS